MTAVFTVTCRSRPLAVLRAASADDAIERARELVALRWRMEIVEDVLETREPNDGEMVGWLHRRDDILLP
jgi:hypothetical protein